MKEKEILQQHHLKSTPIRMQILKILNSGNPVLEKNIRQKLLAHSDRVTIYRTLNTLLKEKIIHKIITPDQKIAYALNLWPYQLSQHIHFVCNNCHEMFCCQPTIIKNLKLPQNFLIEQLEIQVKGICNNCINN